MSWRKNKPTKILVHHSGVSRKKQFFQFLAVDRYHKEARYSDGTYKFHNGTPSSMGYYGGYHIFIEPNGAEFRYRRDDQEGAHCKGQNDSSLAVSMAGNFDVETPTPEQQARLKKRLQKWLDKYPSITAIDIEPHRKYANKSCPGALLADDYGRRLVDPIYKGPEVVQQVQSFAKKLDNIRLLLLQIKIKVEKLLREIQNHV